MPPKGFKNISLQQDVYDLLRSQPDYQDSVSLYIKKLLEQKIQQTNSIDAESSEAAIAYLLAHCPEWGEKKVLAIAAVLIDWVLEN